MTRESVKVLSIFGTILREVGLSEFIELAREAIDEAVTITYVDPERRNLTQWDAHKGKGYVNKTKKLRQRKIRVEKLFDALNRTKGEMRSLGNDIRKREESRK